MYGLKKVKEDLSMLVQEQMTHSNDVDTKELGEVIDMIKDISEALYYCAITDAMEEGGSREKGYRPDERYYEPMYYREPMPYYTNDYTMYNGGRNGGNGGNMTSSGSRYYTEDERYMGRDDYRRADARRMYTESRKMHNGMGESMKKELEYYMKELGTDISELVTGSTPEEKSALKQKLMTLAEKIV